MRKYQIILLVLMLCSFLFSGCSKKSDNDVKIIDETISKEDLPSCIKLGTYKSVAVAMPEEKAITEEDIKEQIDYALKDTGETTLTKENVKKISGFSTVAKYKESIQENLRKLNASSRNNELMDKAWDAALNKAILIKCSKKMLNTQMAGVKANYENYMSMLGMTYDEVLKHFGVTETDIKTKAINYIKSDTMVYAIAKAENIVVSDAEYKQEVQKRMKFYGLSTEQELADMLGSNDLHFVFLADKVMKFVYQNAKIVTSE